jgi:PKHD-type hydroxylase
MSVGVVRAVVPGAIGDRLRIFPAAVPASMCAAIVARGEALAHAPGTLHNNATGERYLDPQVRMTSVGWFAGPSVERDLLARYAGDVNADWGFDLTGADELQYAVYRRNDFFECHKDILRVRAGPIRKISVVLQLSDPATYRGGQLQFIDDEAGLYRAEAFASQGSVAVFASTLKHRVTPVKQGERRSLTAWFKGPAFR